MPKLRKLKWQETVSTGVMLKNLSNINSSKEDLENFILNV